MVRWVELAEGGEGKGPQPRPSMTSFGAANRRIGARVNVHAKAASGLPVNRSEQLTDDKTTFEE